MAEICDDLILQRYRPLELAGVGGYGQVILAWDTRIQRRVAIKIIQLTAEQIPLNADVSEMRLPGLEEARTAALLSDPSIVGVYDFALEDNCCYMIMEYIDGIPLSRILRDADQGLSLDVVAWVAKTVGQALAVAHENQVLHLDIKPDNILIDRKGQVKVTDFGLARLSDADGFKHAQGGTISYMPLEQMRLESLDERCDEWALASLIYEMLTGSNPFRAPDLVRAQKVIENAEIVLPSVLVSDLAAAADDVIFFALDPNRDERYETVAEFLDYLLPYLGDPKKGKRQLANQVRRMLNDETASEDLFVVWPEDAREAEFSYESSGLRGVWTMLRRRKGLWVRAVSMVGSALLLWFALAPLSFLGGFSNPIFLGSWVLLVGLSAALPYVGSLLALLVLGASLCVLGLVAPGVLLIVSAGIWWIQTGLKNNDAALALFTPVIFGFFGFGVLLAYVAGWRLDKKAALETAIMGLILAFVLSLSSQGSLFAWQLEFSFGSDIVSGATAGLLRALSLPLNWFYIPGALGASLGISWAMHQPSRFKAAFGVIGASGLLFVCLCLGWFVQSGLRAWIPSPDVFLPLLVGACLCLILLILDNPMPPEFEADEGAYHEYELDES